MHHHGGSFNTFSYFRLIMNNCSKAHIKKKNCVLTAQDVTYTTFHHLKHRTSLWFCSSVISHTFFIAKHGQPPTQNQQAAEWLMPNGCVQPSLNAQWRWYTQCKH
jgi:hypothetical protein